MKAFLANIGTFTYSAREALAFRRSTDQVQVEQTRVLTALLKRNRNTVYGRRFHFNEIKSIAEYQEKVPLVVYEDVIPYIDRIAAGEHDVLFRGLPLCLHPTSGSTSAPKWIPFTPDLREQYQRGVQTWYFDMHAQCPWLLKGTTYWSISPALTKKAEEGTAVTVGFLEDTEYLSPIMGGLLRQSFVVPKEVALIDDAATFRYVTLAFLLKARDLSFVSIWNPTFFLLLIETFLEHSSRLATDIGAGEISGLSKLPENLRRLIAAAFGRGNKKRAEELRVLVESENKGGETIYRKLWPKLSCISCWVDAEAQGPADRLQELFPTVKIQPKGLMATEGIVSLALTGTLFPVLSIRSHFFEFIPLKNDSSVVGAWELEEGQLYEVVLTTAGGFYRYRLGDIVKVRGHHNQCPMLEFMGRGASSCDIYGEKLHQMHVSEIIREVFSDRKPSSYFALLAPDGSPSVARYTLFLAASPAFDDNQLVEIRRRFECSLRKNFHYDYCRKLGQLLEIEICRVNLSVDNALRLYLDEMKSRGLREGDIKPVALDSRPVWRKVFGVEKP